jgi:hypothetical protein
MDTIGAELGTNYFYYEKGGGNWEHCEVFLRRRGVEEKIGGAERLMYYTTANVMTWIALDEQLRITNYSLCSQ